MPRKPIAGGLPLALSLKTMSSPTLKALVSMWPSGEMTMPVSAAGGPPQDLVRLQQPLHLGVGILPVEFLRGR